MSDAALFDAVDSLCREAETGLEDEAAARAVLVTRKRLHDPLRVAIAGRVKAGKSTVLNALIGERLAPTDASECTKIPTWYRWGPYYEVTTTGSTGETHPTPFTHRDGVLDFGLPPGAADSQVERIDVAWPSTRLKRVTFVDTPGLGSTDGDVEQRTLRFFEVDGEQAAQVDAVVYLLRHAHRTDAAFLDAFTDHSVGGGSPVNAVGVLSRADEVGAGRLDAMVSARAVAGRYAADPRLRQLASGCIAVAGLLAETAATFTEVEAAALRTLARVPAAERQELLLSVDHLMAPGFGDLSETSRRELLLRLGMFGVRFALHVMEDRGELTAAELSRELNAVSGMEDLRAALEGQLLERATLLKSSSALASLRAVARALGTRQPSAASDLQSKIERISASAHELAELRLLNSLRTGELELTVDEITEVETLLGRREPAARVGLAAECDDEDVRSVALGAIARWRHRAASPLTSRDTANYCEIITRTYEGIYNTGS